MFDHKQGVLLEPLITDLDPLASGNRNKNTLQVNTALRELPRMPGRCDPEVDADSETSLRTVPSGIEDMPGRMSSPYACLVNDNRTPPTRNGGRFSPSKGAFSVGPGLETECPSSPKFPDGSFELSAQARDGVNAAAVLLAEGLYEQAFSLYSHWSNEAWASRTDNKARKCLLSLVAGMSLSASTLPEALDAGSKMQQLIAIDKNPLWLGSKSEIKLYTYLAILLLRFQRMPEAWDHLEYAFQLINRSLLHGHGVSEDWRATTNILCQSAARFSYKSRSSAGKDFSKQLEGRQVGWLSVERTHDKMLQRLFHCCVSMLEMADLKLQLAEELRTYQNHGCSVLEIKSTLHICLFRHFWHTFATSTKETTGSTAGINFIVSWLSGTMQIGCVDFFSVIALALIDMTSPLPNGEKQRSVTGIRESAWSAFLLHHIHQNALVLVAGERSLGQLIQWFLAAHASITLRRVAKRSPSASAEHQISLVRETLQMPVAFESSRQGCAGGVAFRTEHPTLSEDISPNIARGVSLRTGANRSKAFVLLRADPPLNPTPGSSWSSGSRSMLSLQRRIKNAGVYGGSSADGSSANMDLDSDQNLYGGSPEHRPEIRNGSFFRESW